MRAVLRNRPAGARRAVNDSVETTVETERTHFLCDVLMRATFSFFVIRFARSALYWVFCSFGPHRSIRRRLMEQR